MIAEGDNCLFEPLCKSSDPDSILQFVASLRSSIVSDITDPQKKGLGVGFAMEYRSALELVD